MKQTIQTKTRFDLAKAAAERAQLYRLLAAVFREEPDSELIAHLRSEGFQNLLTKSGFDLGGVFAEMPMSELKKLLAEEFTRLFLGPGKHISPHESVQLRRGSGTLWGQETVLVRRFIEAAGFEYDRDFTGIPDHISVELEFLAALTETEADSWTAGDTVAAKNVLDWQLDFIARHAGKWVPVFCGKVANEAALPFYGVFSKLLKAFLAGEKSEISACLQKAFPHDRRALASAN